MTETTYAVPAPTRANAAASSRPLSSWNTRSPTATAGTASAPRATAAAVAASRRARHRTRLHAAQDRRRVHLAAADAAIRTLSATASERPPA